MAVPRSVRLKVVASGDQADGHVARFEGWNGSRFLRRVLEEAGLTEGEFVYHMNEWFKSSGFTKPVQPRRFDHHGVHLWLKPGGNGSAVKGLLIPERGADVYYPPEEVYRRLKAYVDGQDARKTEPDAPEEVDDETTEILLLALNEANANYHGTWPAFETAAIATLRALSFETDGETLDRMLTALAARGLVNRVTNYAAVSLEGQAWLTELAGRRPPAAETPPAGASAPPADPPSALDLLETRRAKLERLMTLPGLIRKSRDRQAELTRQIDDLLAKLEAEKNTENGFLAEIDADAVRRLLG